MRITLPRIPKLLPLLVVAFCLPIAQVACADAKPNEMLYEEIPVGFTAEGYPYMGRADAPVVVEEWSDYLCPFCRRHFQATFPQLREQYIKNGQMKLVFRDFPLTGLHPTAPAGHVAARCAGREGPVAYWKMHDALFERQQEWNRLPDAGEFFKGLAGELELEVEAFEACRAEPAVAAQVARSVQEGSGYDLTGTPSFRFVDADDKAYPLIGALPIARFDAYTQALLAGEAPPEPKKPPPPELPTWAKPEGLQPDAAKPGYTVAGDQFDGNPKAKVVVFEFFDYECPACANHALKVHPQVDKALVETGEVMWVYKNLPLKEHPYAAVAAAAAECASDQGGFGRYRHALFEQAERWANEAAPRHLAEIAKEIGLDEQVFNACFDSRGSMERVLADIYDAQGVIKTTPRFVILSGGRGEATGPLGAEQFITELRERLNTQLETDEEDLAAEDTGG